jgi:hypothetical protein
MILFLDDNPARHKAMIGPRIIHCYTIDDFLQALNEYDSFQTISLDYDLNDFDTVALYNGTEATGLDACGLLVNQKYRSKLPQQIIVHSANPTGSLKMVEFLRRYGIKAVRQIFPVV